MARHGMSGIVPSLCRDVFSVLRAALCWWLVVAALSLDDPHAALALGVVDRVVVFVTTRVARKAGGLGPWPRLPTLDRSSMPGAVYSFISLAALAFACCTSDPQVCVNS